MHKTLPTILFAVLIGLFTLPLQAALPAQALAPSGTPVPTLAPMLKRVLPSVVGIVSEGEVVIANNPLLNDPFFRYFFDLPQRPPREKTRGIGSGVIVDAKRGYIVTNSHVVADATKVTVKLADDRDIIAKIVGSDPETDIAVLQIKADDLQALPIADSDQLQVGDFVVAIGNPFGLRQTVTSGIVSALGRSGMDSSKYENFIQTDASINPGNSGGALINLNGELVGINSAIFSTNGGGNIGIGFAIPTNTVQVVMKQIIEYGEVQRGQLGIVGQDLTPELAKAFGIKQTHGVVIAQVINGSAADKAGLKTGDVITAVNGREIKEFAQLRNAIGLLRIGDTVTIDVLREGKPRSFTAQIAAPKESTVSSGSLHPGLAGAVFGEMDSDHPLAGRVEGVLVREVAPGSPAANAGLMPGDVVTSVNRRPVTNLESFKALAGAKSGQILLHLRRGRGALFLLIS